MKERQKHCTKRGLWFRKTQLEQIQRVSKERRVSQQKIIESAIDYYLNGKEEDFQGLLIRRINRTDNRNKVLSRQMEILAESFALFIRMWLTSSPEVPESQRDTAFLRGQERFDKFIGNLTKRLSVGKNFFADLPREVVLVEEDFDGK